MSTLESHGRGSATEQAGEPRAFETVLQHLTEQILDGRLTVGDRLPPERELAQQLGVSRPAIREAIRTLEAQGVLASRVGSGASAGTHVISERSQALQRLLRLQVTLAQFPLHEVVVARIALERGSAALACSSIDEDGLAALRGLLERMDQAEDRDEFNELDTRFHVGIAQHSGNTMLADLTQAVRESLRTPILEAERRVEDWEALRVRLRHDHHGILEAIAAGDASLAERRMEEHIRHAYGLLPLGGQPID
ncbi:FadR/GntR family transcriptional regulator [Luteococcus peritonei]|uniref:FadR/GntR family transcriptional regulator n=1 Tax=Luteococcus peritonei TaxID=88874 RepID=A0ABW4RTF8_9ACTN